MKKYSTFVGMDVHKNSIEIAIAQRGRNGEVRSYGKIDGTLDAFVDGNVKVYQLWQNKSVPPVSL